MERENVSEHWVEVKVPVEQIPGWRHVGWWRIHNGVVQYHYIFWGDVRGRDWRPVYERVAVKP